HTAELRFMAMEFLPESLKQRLQARGRLEPDEALAIANQVASALFHAHRKGFVHRDVKPDNIMFRTDGTPVLLDFGIARVLESTTALTRSGMTMGTPRYMSPEQLNAKRADGRSDVYSLGVVLYEMLSGAPPFKGSQTVSVIMKHVSEPVPPLPVDLAAYQGLVDRLLAKERNKRPASEREWQELVKPLIKPFRLPKAEKPRFTVPPKGQEADRTRQSGIRPAVPRRSPKPAPRSRPSRPLRRLALNLLLILALAAWIFFNHERIPGMIASLARAVASWVSSLLAKI
ncbi:MAG: serine/threonine protein kinase, partial [Candidatus Aminicenantes bacterium]|nr:serine/threonine protein kinase [Candidatus Aminicenantes bacterium]